jgi:hypothetical protein
MEMMTLTDPSGWRRTDVRPRDEWIVGLDVGQSIDPSAVCALNYKVTPGEHVRDERNRVLRQSKTERFLVRHLERLPLGMPYPQQIEHVANMLGREPLIGATFALDFTGCGRPVADQFERAGLRPQKVLITAGNEVTTNSGNVHHVPKGFLVSGLESRMHSGELKIAADLTESPALKEELRDFGRKVSESGRVTYNARSGAHDDLILAICIALFIATNRPTVHREELRV